MNSAINYNFRKLETTDINHFNNSTSTGSRNIRLNYLLNEKYKGKINIENSKQILSDHHDSLLNMDIMSQRNICKHQESDNDSNLIKMMVPTVLSSLKNHPSGCVDGKVTDSNLASQMRFVGRFGSSCGRVFNLNEYKKSI